MEIIKLKQQIASLEDDNLKIKETTQVKLRFELGKISHERDVLSEKLKEANDEIIRQSNQITDLIGKPLDDLEKREELELTRQMQIDRLNE